MEVPADPLGVGKDLRRKRIPFLGNVAGLFEEWQIKVAFDIALCAGVPVPVPGAAKITRFLDNAEVVAAGLLQPDCREHPTEAPADNHHIAVLVQRCASETRCYIRVRIEMLELSAN